MLKFVGEWRPLSPLLPFFYRYLKSDKFQITCLGVFSSGIVNILISTYIYLCILTCTRWWGYFSTYIYLWMRVAPCTLGFHLYVCDFGYARPIIESKKPSHNQKTLSNGYRQQSQIRANSSGYRQQLIEKIKLTIKTAAYCHQQVLSFSPSKKTTAMYSSSRINLNNGI